MRLLGRKKTRIALAIVGAVLLLVGFLIFPERSHPRLKITFERWTNSEAQRVIMFRIPEVMNKAPKSWVWKNRFWTTYYDFKVEFEAVRKEGQPRRGSIQHITTDTSGLKERDISFPVFDDELSVRITNAVGRIKRNWKNTDHVLSFLPERRFTFEVSPPQPIPK
jgi:hypothetical protein